MFNEDMDFLGILTPEQLEACICPDNMLLTACPGSGKTKTVVYKLVYLKKAFSNSRKLHIAITYTNRAAEEIESRVSQFEKVDNIWIGTIHQFCMDFIIRPYSMYSDRLKSGYHIIDEYEKKGYLKEIAKKKGISCKDHELEKNKVIYNAYKNLLQNKNEIDFDSILELSLDLLNNSPYVAENIASIICSIQVDEYQDTNNFQYLILSKIYAKNKSIILSFIGDVNQAIYSNLGGVAKTIDELNSLFGTCFKELHLTGCYRSSQKIIDYYSNFAVNPINIHSLNNDKNIASTICYNRQINRTEIFSYIASIVEDNLKKKIQPNEICIIAPTWYLIYPLAKELRKKLPDISFDAPDISPFKYDPMNPFYLIAKILFTRRGHYETRKRNSIKILKILKKDYGLFIPDDYDCFTLLEEINSVSNTFLSDGIDLYRMTVNKIIESLSICFDDEPVLYKSYVDFLNKTEQRINDYSLPSSAIDLFKFFERRNGLVINTIHGVKGQEYTSVIAFGLLNGYIPHWEVINNHKEQRNIITNRLLYVLCSRAKHNLYLIAEKGRNYGQCKSKSYKPTNEIDSLKWNYD